MAGLTLLTEDILGPFSLQVASAAIPPPVRRTVSGFTALHDDVGSLPSLEQIELVLLAQWVVDTHELADFPVVKVRCIGHADRDFQRGKDFEQQISEKRSRAVMLFLQAEIHRISFDIWAAMQQGYIQISSRIKFESTGIGSAEHKPATDEAGRRRNRRVVIVFEKGPSPQPPAKPFVPDIFTLPPPRIPMPDPPAGPWFAPLPKAIKMPKSRLEEIITKVRNSPIKYFDMGSIAKATLNLIKDGIDPNLTPQAFQKAEDDLKKDLDDWLREEQRKRDVRTKDPPGEPEPEDQVRPKPEE